MRAMLSKLKLIHWLLIAATSAVVAVVSATAGVIRTFPTFGDVDEKIRASEAVTDERYDAIIKSQDDIGERLDVIEDRTFQMLLMLQKMK